MFRLRKRGQSTAEYAIVIGLVIAAAVAMQVYVKRGVQAKIKGVVDHKPDAMFTTDQFEPDYASSDMDSTRKASVTTETKGQGAVDRTIADEGEVTKRWGSQTTSGLPAAE
ncbi:MAG: hypothetical protein M0R17_13640 [Candidatus Omnitrophica bacterium]|jgi:uncharacterized protein (UPF0333 family)|nr:hypothetical protein [Candidatus Omnitrophota bacterium]MDD5253023.1 hypothetical protein [Candidatus Omnitrophota bacterium]